MTTSKLSPEVAQKLLGEAEKRLGTDGPALRRMALLAYDYRRDGEALAIMSAAWQRSARWLAQAVVSFPRHFMKYAEAPEPNPTADELLSLFMIVQRPKAERVALYAEMQRKHLTALQVRDRIQDLKDSARVRKGGEVRVRLKGAKVIKATPTELHLKFSEPRITPADWEGLLVTAGSIRAQAGADGA